MTLQDVFLSAYNFHKDFFYNLFCYCKDFLFQILALIMLPTSFIKPQGFCEHLVVAGDLCRNYFLLKTFNYCSILHWGTPSNSVTSPNKLLPQSYNDTLTIGHGKIANNSDATVWCKNWTTKKWLAIGRPDEKVVFGISWKFPALSFDFSPDEHLGGQKAIKGQQLIKNTPDTNRAKTKEETKNVTSGICCSEVNSSSGHNRQVWGAMLQVPCVGGGRNCRDGLIGSSQFQHQGEHLSWHQNHSLSVENQPSQLRLIWQRVADTGMGDVRRCPSGHVWWSHG